jgi:hypothetical protein
VSRVAIFVGLVGILVLSACAPRAPVVQGKVVAVDPGGGVIRVQDELNPGAEPLAFDIATAEIGTAPKPGDIVRIVYRAGASSNQALRVMNVSRQRTSQ